ncbi:HXXEE domain-containing protein, partial [Candidatus Gracilibacteria bacterium]
PSFITSIIEIPICFYIIYFVFNKYNFSLNEVFLYSVFAIIIIIFNLYLVHKVMKKYFNS